MESQMEQNENDLDEFETNDSEGGISDGSLTVAEANQSSRPSSKSSKRFEDRDILNPPPIVPRPEKVSHEISDGRITNRGEEVPEHKLKEIIVPKRHTKCMIGGVWYEFNQGQKYRVTKLVKERLKASGSLEVL